MSAADVVLEDPATVPGGMQEYLSRTVEGKGLVEFEYAPVGYLTKKGEPRKKDWRRYHFTPEGETKREGRVSVTTLLDLVTSKGGLPYWFEGGGIKGTQEAHRRGLLSPEDTLDRAVEVVRAKRLGAEAERDRAADRGLNVHALLEEYARTGNAPNPGQHPEIHRGYIKALVRWLLHADPEPTMVEELVACDEYAGRMDLRANTRRGLGSYDAKTQEKGGIYLSAHVQLALYNRAARWCGDAEPDYSQVVVFAENGEFREMELAITEEAAQACLAWYRLAQPVESMCASQNRAEKQARRAVAA